jgi:uncharacterized membrane protein YgcG
MKNKIMSLLLVVAVALSMTMSGFTMEAKAAATVPVSVSSVTGEPGDTVKVSVSFGISEETPVKCAQFKLSYDKTKLTVVDAVHTSNAPKGLRLFNTDTAGTVNWGWADTNAYTTGGEWVEITFTINEGASGTAPLTLYDSLCAAEADTENYSLAISDGAVTISGSIVYPGSEDSDDDSTGNGTSGGTSSGSSSGGGSSGGGSSASGSTVNDDDSSSTENASASVVKKVKITKNKSKIKVGKTFRFKAKTIGKKATIKWSVSKKKVGTINKKTGKFKAKKPGKVIVYAKAGGKTAKYKVKVVK